LRYKGDNEKYPKPLWGEFEHGSQGPWSLSTALKLLLPEGTTVPLLAATMAAVQPSLNAAAFLTALHVPVPISPIAASALQSGIISRSMAYGFDVWTTASADSHPLLGLVCALAVNRPTVAGSPSGDPFSLMALRGWVSKLPMDVVFVSVSFELVEEVLKAVLPLALQLVCVWAPAGELSVLNAAEFQWLEGMRQRGLVRFIPAGDEGCWVLLARSTSTWHRCLTTAALAMTAWV
jgi:hypothetical protein